MAAASGSTSAPSTNDVINCMKLLISSVFIFLIYLMPLCMGFVHLMFEWSLNGSNGSILNFGTQCLSSRAYHLDFNLLAKNFLAENGWNKNNIACCFYISFDEVVRHFEIKVVFNLHATDIFSTLI